MRHHTANDGSTLDRPTRLSLAILIGVLVMTALLRLAAAPAQLWLDETWTGMVAAQPTWADAIWQIRSDVNAPLYYLISHAVGSVFGVSNLALRAPAFLFGLAAPLVALWPRSQLSWRERGLWAVCIACWAPGLWYSQEARGFTLLLLLGTASTIAYGSLLREPRMKQAFVWSALGVLLIATHYFAAMLIVAQAVICVAIHRQRALRLWPAGLLAVPLVAWTFTHLPRMAEFARPEVAWYDRLQPGDLLPILAFAAGGLVALIQMAVWMTAILVARARARPAARGAMDWGSWAPVAASLLGSLLLILLGFVRPTFTVRYLMPFIPGIFLGLVLLACRTPGAGRWAPISLAAIVVVSAGASAPALFRAEKAYSFQGASDWLMAQGARRLVFLWDHPNNAIEAPRQIGAVGGFFFARAGRPIPVHPVKVGDMEDPNRVLLAHAAPAGSAILWGYDKGVRHTAANRHPPAIAAMAPGWRCEDFGKGNVGIIACIHSGGRT